MGAQVVAREALDHAVTYHLEPLRQVSLLSHAEEERGQMRTSTLQRVRPWGNPPKFVLVLLRPLHKLDPAEKWKMPCHPLASRRCSQWSACS